MGERRAGNYDPRAVLTFPLSQRCFSYLPNPSFSVKHKGSRCP
jgi:hypothetical protein